MGLWHRAECSGYRRRIQAPTALMAVAGWGVVDVVYWYLLACTLRAPVG